MDCIESLQEYALVGRWHFPEMDDTKMRHWVELQWKPLIDYTPIVARLLKEWYCFHFLSTNDLEAIQNHPWVYGRSFLALRKWYMGYNLLENTPINNLIWVKLPGLPLELWSKETLTKIGNAIGRCVYVDPRCLGGKDKCVAWILIEKAYRGGFPDHIKHILEGAKNKSEVGHLGSTLQMVSVPSDGTPNKKLPSSTCPKKPKASWILPVCSKLL